MRKSRYRLVAAGLAAVALGAPGEAGAAETATTDLVDRSALRVCADPNNLPFSNQAGEGFENKIAALLAEDLGVPVAYTYYPDTMGFVRNTLNALSCDVIIGTTAGNELVQNTNPYYTSTYALVYRADSDLDIDSLSDPELRDLTIGAMERTPPVTLLARHGLLDNLRSYHLMVDTRHYAPGRDLVGDVASGKVDVGVLWGPIAGYWAQRQDVPVNVVPLLNEPGAERLLNFRIAMGIRHGEQEWKHRLNELIAANQDEINAILLDYGVPLLDRRGRPIEQQAGAAGEGHLEAAPAERGGG